MSAIRTVTTQAELDAALADTTVHTIDIESESGVWLHVSASGSATVSAYDSATVRAYGSATVRASGSATVSASGSATVSASGSATVRAYDSATVRAYGSATVRASGSATVSASDSATVRAYDSATVRAYDSATVSAYDSATVRASGSATVSASGSATVSASGSATVSASGSATVRASGSATVRAYDSATVRAYDSATVSAYDSATVSAYDSATVRAYDSATVRAYDSATVSASKFTAVHLHSSRVTVTGGHVIDVTQLDMNDPRQWCDYHGITLTDREGEQVAVLYKAVSAELHAGEEYRLTAYPIGQTVRATDWRDDNNCGGGLHVAPTPEQGRSYRPNRETDTRFLRVLLPVDQLRPIGSDKCKAPWVHVLAEVDAYGRDVPAAVEVQS